MPLSFGHTFVIKRCTPSETLIMGIKLFFVGITQFALFPSRPCPFFRYKRSHIPSVQDTPQRSEGNTENTMKWWHSRILGNSYKAAKPCLVTEKKIVRKSS
jgi:hypothetical protein